MSELFSRSELLLGSKAMSELSQKKVAVFGVGGVGGYTVEALARTGIGKLILIDNDTVACSNINRQIIAAHSTVGRSKVEVMRERILDINPDIQVEIYQMFYLPGQTLNMLENCDYIVDAIDTVSAKLALVEEANKRNISIISAMGCGDKLNPMGFEVDDINKTSVCPLCRVMRTELRKRGIKGLKVVYSKEMPAIHQQETEENDNEKPRKRTPGSLAFVPSVAGLIMAGEVIKDLCGDLWPSK